MLISIICLKAPSMFELCENTCSVYLYIYIYNFIYIYIYIRIIYGWLSECLFPSSVVLSDLAIFDPWSWARNPQSGDDKKGRPTTNECVGSNSLKLKHFHLSEFFFSFEGRWFFFWEIPALVFGICFDAHFVESLRHGMIHSFIASSSGFLQLL